MQIRGELAEKELILLQKEQELLDKEQDVLVLTEEVGGGHVLEGHQKRWVVGMSWRFSMQGPLQVID